MIRSTKMKRPMKILRNFLVANLCALVPLWIVTFGWMPDQVKVEVRGTEPVALLADGLMLQGEEHGHWKEGTVWRFYLKEGMAWQDLAFCLPEGMLASGVKRVELQKWKLVKWGKDGIQLGPMAGGGNVWRFTDSKFDRLSFASGKIALAFGILEMLLLGVSWGFAKWKREQRWQEIWLPALLVSLALMGLMQVVFPVQSWIANRAAYPFCGGELATAVTVQFAWTFALSVVALTLLSMCFGRWVLGIVLAFEICVYLESGILSEGLPSLNGDWSFFQDSVRAHWDAGIWIAVFALMAGLYPWLKTHYGLFAVGMIIMATASLLDVKHSEQADASNLIVHNFTTCEDVIHNISYSTNRNVMVFIIDSMEREQAHAIMEDAEVGPKLREQFRGFTEFVDNVGALPFSMAAIANLMTGQYPENTGSMVNYFWSCYSPDSALAEFLKTEHAVYMTTPELECAFSSESSQNKAQGIRKSSPLSAKGGGAWSLTDLNRWRWMPFAIKAPYAYLMEIQGVADGDFREWRVFPILAKDEAVNDKNGVFMFIHTPGVHVPTVCDRNGTLLTVPGNDENGCFEQGIYILKLLGDLMDSYREKGIYDNSHIIVLGDHGRHQWGGYTLETNMLPFNGRPFLWMKPMAQTTEFTSSSIPSSHAKVAEVLKRAAHHDLTDEEIREILATEQRVYHRIEWWGGIWNEWVVGKDGTTVFREGKKNDFGDGAKPLQCGKRYSFKIVDFAQNGADVYFSNVVNQDGLPVFRPNSGEMKIQFRVPDATKTYQAKLWTGDIGGGTLEVNQSVEREGEELPVSPQTGLTIHNIVSDSNGMATLRFRWKESGTDATATKFESFVLENEP